MAVAFFLFFFMGLRAGQSFFMMLSAEEKRGGRTFKGYHEQSSSSPIAKNSERKKELKTVNSTALVQKEGGRGECPELKGFPLLFFLVSSRLVGVDGRERSFD
jgi:hypothetical protein